MDDAAARPEPPSTTPDLRLITGTEPDFEQHDKPERGTYRAPGTYRGHRMPGTYRGHTSPPSTAPRKPEMDEADRNARTI